MDIANVVNNIVISGVPAGVLITLLIQLAKALGMPSEYSRYVNGGLAVISVLVAHLLAIGVLDAGVVTLVIQALVAFLVAAGFYDVVVQPVAEKKSNTG